MKSRYNKTSKDELNTFTITDMVVIVMICITFTIVIIGFVNSIMLQSGTTVLDEAIDIWDEAFRRIAKDRIGIHFIGITTTKDEWRNFQTISDEYVAKNGEAENRLVISPDIQEEIYVDKKYSDGQKTGATFSTDSENPLKINYLGQIFFQNALLTRYVSQDGKMSVIMVLQRTDCSDNYIPSNPIVLELTNSSEIKKYKKEFSDEVDKNSPNMLSEKQYTDEIISIIKGIYTSKSTSEVREIKNRARKYFSPDGRDTIFKGKNQLNFKDEIEVNVNYADMGKSQANIDSEYKDRLFLQLSVNPVGDEANSVVVNIILKMDSYGYIFDIDLV